MELLIINNAVERKLAIHAFNLLGAELEAHPEYAKVWAKECGCTEEEIWEAVEELYTNN